jgi:DNA-binding transcriptional LysR family regulator
MELRELRLFVAVVEEGSIHAGARRLRLTQPAVSQTLRKLERQVGGPLLVRTARGVQLTPAGAALLEQAYDILGRMDAATAVVRRVAHTGNATVRVGLIAGAASAGHLTHPIIDGFRRRYPDLHVRVSELSFANQFAALVEGLVDVAIVRPPCDDDRLEVVGLFSEPTVLCVPAAHRLAAAEAVSLNDILDEPMVELVRAPARWRNFWKLDELRGGPPSRVHREPAVTLPELRRTLIRESVLVAGSRSAWQYGLSSPLLRAIPILEAPRNPIGVAYRRAPPLAWAREFARCAREVSSELLQLVPGGIAIEA